jgi:hypothetical protein
MSWMCSLSGSHHDMDLWVSQLRCFVVTLWRCGLGSGLGVGNTYMCCSGVEICDGCQQLQQQGLPLLWTQAWLGRALPSQSPTHELSQCNEIGRICDDFRCHESMPLRTAGVGSPANPTFQQPPFKLNNTIFSLKLLLETDNMLHVPTAHWQGTVPTTWTNNKQPVV